MVLANLGQIELDYERSGSGPPLLLMMGMSGTFLTWGEPFLEALRADFEVIVYDHRGVGASTRLTGPITISEMAEDAAGLIAALGLDSAHVLGISMGGMIAQELALARPELIRTLSLGCTYCGGPGSVRMTEGLAERLDDARLSGDREQAVRAYWEANVSAGFAADEDAWSRFLGIAMHRTVSLAVTLEQIRAITAHDTSARLADIDLPTLVVHGTVDQVLPVQNGHIVAGLIPGARLETLEGVGHLFFWERPEYAAELIRATAAVHA
jgi:3-oxoadipate enol-lactonase